MPLLTPEQCRAQCRVDGDYADAELATLLASAEDAAAAYLNRSLFSNQAGLDAVLDAFPAEAAAAASAYSAALAAADAEPDTAKAEAMRSVARLRKASTDLAQSRNLAGLVVNPSVLAAVRLTLAHLWENPGAVVIGATAVELPLGVQSLLRPYRRVMMP
ncbi:head-tail connector protein [Stenotrophomonas maltophilia]|uniref:head-tail connector protein n=1 Tax=Stenotrophomonas maltophilia TaxID=40324 RepID=UPI0013DD71C7|nr:head-tail connector protein [Stenotrophomonas maltophilia]